RERHVHSTGRQRIAAKQKRTRWNVACRSRLCMKHHHVMAPIFIALFACNEAGETSEQSVAEDALMTMTSSTTSTSSTTTSSTAGGAADECVLPGSRRVPR